MAGIAKRVYANRRNVDIGGGVDKAGLPGSVGMPVMLRRITQTRAPNSTKESPTINGSLYFDGTATSRILIDNGEDLELDGDFTIEWFQYQTNDKGNTATRIFQIGNFEENGNSNQAEFGFSIEAYGNELYGNELYVAIKGYDHDGNGIVNSDDAFMGYTVDMDIEIGNVYNKWLHFAIVRNNDIIRLYVNGKRASKILDNGLPNNINTIRNKNLCIGNETIPSDNTAFEGHITNFRWINGQALYSGDLNTENNFQLPTSPLTALPGTKLLFLAQNKAPYANGKDAVTTVSNITWSPKSPFN